MAGEGCTQQGSSLHSGISGYWCAKGPVAVGHMQPENVRTEILALERNPAQFAVIIRNDGSFDLSNTMLGACEGIEHLRKKGDRIYVGSDRDPQSQYIEVESSIYTSTRSELVLSEHFPHRTKKCFYFFSVQLIAPSSLLYLSGSHTPK